MLPRSALRRKAGRATSALAPPATATGVPAQTSRLNASATPCPTLRAGGARPIAVCVCTRCLGSFAVGAEAGVSAAAGKGERPAARLRRARFLRARQSHQHFRQHRVAARWLNRCVARHAARPAPVVPRFLPGFVFFFPPPVQTDCLFGPYFFWKGAALSRALALGKAMRVHALLASVASVAAYSAKLQTHLYQTTDLWHDADVPSLRPVPSFRCWRWPGQRGPQQHDVLRRARRADDGGQAKLAERDDGGLNPSRVQEEDTAHKLARLVHRQQAVHQKEAPGQPGQLGVRSSGLAQTGPPRAKSDAERKYDESQSAWAVKDYQAPEPTVESKSAAMSFLQTEDATQAPTEDATQAPTCATSTRAVGGGPPKANARRTRRLWPPSAPSRARAPRRRRRRRRSPTGASCRALRGRRTARPRASNCSRPRSREMRRASCSTTTQTAWGGPREASARITHRSWRATAHSRRNKRRGSGQGKFVSS
eukprot:scaffold91511_cov67-Phaeocystis_antarctica.AAC.2